MVSNLKLIAGAVVTGALLALGLYVWSLRAEVRDLTMQNGILQESLGTALDANEANVRELERQRAAYEHRLSVVASTQETERERAVEVREVIKEVYRAPATNHCTASPAVRRALEWLRQQPAAPRGDGGPGGPPGDPGHPAALPPAASRARD